MNEMINRLLLLFSGYLDLLGRFPDWDGVINHFSSPYPADAISAQILQSEEYHRVNAAVAAMQEKLEAYPDKRHVLLFGAFGNGNLGDRIMAQIVAKHLEAVSDVVCFAYSELQSASYPFAPGRRLEAEDLPLNLRVLALFDAVVIGGGGLLSYTHEPLWDPLWPYTVPVPYGLLSCGVKVPLDSRLENLVRNADVVSSRDKPGYDELATRREDTILCPDPVLSFEPVAAIRPSPTKGRLYILRAPFCDWHRKLKNHMRPDDAIAVFEAHMDHEIISYFNDVHSINSQEDFFKLVPDFELVVSERFHGVILSLLARTPAIGMRRPAHGNKFVSLFQALGIPEHSVDVDDAGFQFAPYDIEPALEKLLAIRSGATASYADFLDRLLSSKGKTGAAPLVRQTASDLVTGTMSATDSRPSLPADRASNLRARLASMRQIHDEAQSSLQISRDLLQSAEESATSCSHKT